MGLGSCGVKRNNLISRKYHSTTTLFNYLYNGEVVYRDAVKGVNAAYRVPPEGYIPIWYAGSEEDSKTFGANFEKAIEKAETALQKHNQKDNKWFDELRFLIGRSWFYKRNYLLAIKNFEHIIKTWPESKIIPDVYLWMVKTHYMDGNSTTALQLLEEKVGKTPLKKRQLGELALVKAQVLLDEKNYEEVIRTLNSNQKVIKGANNRARVHFLLGQLYQDQKSMTRSYENYKIVSKLNTDYELIFNAKIAMAKLLIDGQKGDAQNVQLRRMLKRMLRDEKNADYLDRVYYEIAMLDLKTGDKPAAIGNLKNSVANNTGNIRQKALSYYRIGQIYFYDLKDFKNAQVYFDSASTSITRDAPEYREISMISSTLKEFVGFMNVIELQDSLLRLSKLSDQELDKYVDKVIEEERRRKEAEEAAQLEALNALNDPNVFNQMGDQGRNRPAGFYFDSPDQVNSGRMRFEQTWGNRKLEDNWRRKNKTLVVEEGAGQPTEVVEVTEEDVKKYGSKEKAKMVKMVPRSSEDIAEAQQKLIEAMYGLGQVYSVKLNQPDSSIAVHTRLVGRFPESEFALKARYAMFKVHKGRGEEDLAEDQKYAICSKAPASKYCRLCKGEVIVDETKEGFENFQSAYKALLETYSAKDYRTCLDFSDFIKANFPTDDGLAEVLMIRGKSFGYLGQRDSLKQVYVYIKNNYPDSDVTPEVIRTLAMLEGGPRTDLGQEIPKDNKSNSGAADPRLAGFTSETKNNEKVYVIMFIKKDKITNSDLQIRLNDFNNRFFADNKLNTSIFLYKELHMPYISQFDGFRSALDYISSIPKDTNLDELFTLDNERLMVISPANFRVAYGKKRMEDYAYYYETVLIPMMEGK